MSIADVSGAYNLHVHSSPSLFTRTKVIEGTLVCGGLVLNGFTGGLNPVAVEHALKLGAKQIWLPTIDSLAHSKVFGHVGGFGYQESGIRIPRKGITILRRGRLREEVKTILELVRDHGAILGTGHLGKNEIFQLARFARDMGFARFLVTHPFFHPPNLTVAELVELKSLDVKIELCGGNLYPIPGFGRIDTYREAIAAVGSQSIVLSSDAGQHRKSLPAEVLRVFAQCLTEKGVRVDR